MLEYAHESTLTLALDFLNYDEASCGQFLFIG